MRTITLDLTGMTCAACANRIEKRLSQMDGVRATVNYATNRATVRAEEEVSLAALIEKVEQAGYGASEHLANSPDPDPTTDLTRRVQIAAVFALPVIVISMIPAWQFPAWQWFALAFTIPVLFYAGAPFHRSAWVNARHGATTMDTLVSLGTTAAFAWSLVALIFGHAGQIGMRHEFTFALTQTDGLGNVYFEATCGIILFVLVGRLIEARSRRLAGESVRALADLGAKQTWVLVDGVETLVPVEDVLVGDEFIVRPGEKIATDGVVISGLSALDASLLTGESRPVEVGPGDPVTGGALNSYGRLLVSATRVGADTQLATIARLVEQAQAGKAAIQRLADRISGIFVPIVLVLSVLTLGLWRVFGAEWSFAIQAAVAVLIIACPCALGLATPTALLVGSGRGAELGIIIKGPEVLERVRKISTILLDKTGTLTTGKMRVVDTFGVNQNWPEDRVRALAATAESGSEHPVARAIAEGAVGELSDFRNHPGLGVSATVVLDKEAFSVLVGSPELLRKSGIEIPQTIQDRLAAARALGQTAVVVAAEDEGIGAIVVADEIRPSATSAIDRLKALGIKPVLLTGDHAEVAAAVAKQLGITDVRAQVLPDEKAAAVTATQAEGQQVAMVGDGVNDAAALAAADIGIAFASGTDAAIAAADLTLVGDDVNLVVDALRLSRATLATIHWNLVWAFGYNVAAIPLAALGYLNPMLAGAAMALSSVFVVMNSLRLRGFTSGVSEIKT